MTVPTKKTSKSRTRRRRTINMRKKKSAKSLCPQCKNPKIPHLTCSICGTYKGKQIIIPRAKTKKEKKEKRKEK